MRYYFKLDTDNTIIESITTDKSMGSLGYTEVSKTVFYAKNSYTKYNPLTNTFSDAVADTSNTVVDYETLYTELAAKIETLELNSIINMEMLTEIYISMLGES